MGFRRARLAAVITVTTVTLALTLIGMFAITIQSLSDEFSQTYQRIRLNAFIDPSLNDEQRGQLRDRITAIMGVESILYISPDAAMAQMQAEFDAELIEMLGENPLPPSYEILLKTGISALDSVQSIHRHIAAFPEVDEVVYAENVLRILNRYFEIGATIALLLGGVIFFIAIVLIYNTIRLTIHSRKTIVEIMRLVGATNRFIKAPFVIEGIIQGFLGSILAALILWLATDFVNTVFNLSLKVSPVIYAALVLLGGIIGLMGSYFSVSKYLKV